MQYASLILNWAVFEKEFTQKTDKLWRNWVLIQMPFCRSLIFAATKQVTPASFRSFHTNFTLLDSDSFIIFIMEALLNVKTGFISQGRPQKRNMKENISSAISSQQTSGKNSESEYTCHEKVSQKICRSEPILNSRSRHLRIKVKHTIWMVREARSLSWLNGRKD